MALFAWFILSLFSPTPQPLSLTITSSVPEAGNLHLAIYDSGEGFASRKELLSIVRPSTGKPVSLEVNLPASGKYVLAAFHDLNGNGKLDTNLFGAPVEPYGFSEQPPSKWREPRFEEIATSVTTGSETIRIDLKKWKEY